MTRAATHTYRPRSLAGLGELAALIEADADWDGTGSRRVVPRTTVTDDRAPVPD